MKAKVNFTKELDGVTYTFKNVTVNIGDGSYGYLPMGSVSSVIRQYIKQRWGIVFQISSSSFANGNSVDVYLNDESDKLFNEVRTELSRIFKQGYFNGMTDMYEYTPTVFEFTVDGFKLDVSTKYIHTCNTPKYGTKAWNEYESKKMPELEQV